MTVDRAVLESLANWGEAPCIVESLPDGTSRRSTANECRLSIEQVSSRLASWGLTRGSLVATFLDNSSDFVCLFVALVRLGVVPVLGKLEYRRLELEEIFRNAEPDAVICEERHLPVLAPLLDAGMIVVVRGPEGLALRQSGVTRRSRTDLPEDIASLNYTYRGHGYALGSMVSHEQYLHGARTFRRTLGGLRGETMLMILPMSHIFTMVGCVILPLLHRMTVAITASAHPRRLFDFIRRERVDYVVSVPEVLEMLLRVHDAEAGPLGLKAIVTGGSVLESASYERITSCFGAEVLHGYGLTEFTPVSGNCRGRGRPGTVGPLCEGVECRIQSPAADGTGEIQIRAPRMGNDYYRRPWESHESRDGEWLRTGDAGRMHEGHLIFVGETKQTRKINGSIVDIQEVRRAFLLDPDIMDVEIEHRANTLSARVALSRGIDLEDKKAVLRRSLRGLLASYKIPANITRL